MLFGDSHIEQWLPATAANAVHWRVVNLTKAACPVADLTVYAPSLNRPYTERDQWRTTTLTAITALHPDLVIAGQSDNVPADSAPDRVWAHQTVVTLSRLQQTGAKVDFILDTPVKGQDVPTCLSAHLHDADQCAISRATPYSYPKRHSTVADALTHASITTIEPIDWFCTDTTCPPIVGNILVYRDGTHIHLTANYYGADRPTGTAKSYLANTTLRFDAGDKGLDWLVVTPDGKVAAKGTGTVNGQSGYGFVFYGYDGCTVNQTGQCQPGPDKFRMVLWPLSAGSNPGENTLYDNRPDASYDLDVAQPQELHTGAVTIHPPTN